MYVEYIIFNYSFDFGLLSLFHPWLLRFLYLFSFGRWLFVGCSSVSFSLCSLFVSILSLVKKGSI